MSKGYRLPEVIEPYDLTYMCIPVPDVQEYRIAFWGAVLELTRWWVWEHDGTRRAKEAADYWLTVLQPAYDAWQKGNGCIVDLRPSPIDPCVLEYSNDGGITWQTGFNFEACLEQTGVAIGNEINIQIQADTFIASLVNIYNNNFINIAPDMVYDSSPDDDLRNKALCNALYLFVKQYSEEAKAYAEKKFNQGLVAPSIASLALLGASAAVSVFATPLAGAALFTALGTALGGAGLGIWALLQEGDFAAFEDEAAIREVSCYMYGQMKDANPDAAAFAAALAGEAFTGSAEIIGDAIAPLLADEETYLVLLQYMQDTWNLLQIGIEIACPCDAPWEVVWDFTLSGHGFTPASTPSGDRARYIAGLGWTNGTNQAVFRREVRIIRQGLNFANYTEGEIHYTACKPLTFAGFQIPYNSGSFEQVDNLAVNPMIAPLASAADSIRVDITADDPAPDQCLFITKIVVRGTGTPPA